MPVMIASIETSRTHFAGSPPARGATAAPVTRATVPSGPTTVRGVEERNA